MKALPLICEEPPSFGEPSNHSPGFGSDPRS